MRRVCDRWWLAVQVGLMARTYATRLGISAAWATLRANHGDFFVEPSGSSRTRMSATATEVLAAIPLLTQSLCLIDISSQLQPRRYRCWRSRHHAWTPDGTSACSWVHSSWWQPEAGFAWCET